MITNRRSGTHQLNLCASARHWELVPTEVDSDSADIRIVRGKDLHPLPNDVALTKGD